MSVPLENHALLLEVTFLWSTTANMVRSTIYCNYWLLKMNVFSFPCDIFLNSNILCQEKWVKLVDTNTEIYCQDCLRFVCHIFLPSGLSLLLSKLAAVFDNVTITVKWLLHPFQGNLTCTVNAGDGHTIDPYSPEE